MSKYRFKKQTSLSHTYNIYGWNQWTYPLLSHSVHKENNSKLICVTVNGLVVAEITNISSSAVF